MKNKSFIIFAFNKAVCQTNKPNEVVELTTPGKLLSRPLATREHNFPVIIERKKKPTGKLSPIVAKGDDVR